MAEQAPSARSGLHSVTHGTVLMLLGTLVYVGATFLTRVVLVRTLSLADWSDFAFAVALAGLLASIGTIGLPQAVARSLPFAPRDDERRTIVRSASFVLIASAIGFTAGLAVTGVLIGQFYNAPALAETLVAFSVAVGCSILSALVISVFQGFEDVRPNVVFVQVLNPAAFFVFVVVLFRFSPHSLLFPEALGGFVAANLLMIVGLGLYTRRRLPAHLPEGPRAPAAARRLYLFAIPLAAVAVAGFVTGNADLLLLGAFHYASVGSYSATLTLARLLQIGVGSLAYIFLPVAARFVRENDVEGVRLTYATATKWVALTSLPLFLLFFFFPSASLGFVYGSLYTGSTVPLRILALGAIVSTLVGPAAATQVSFGQTRLLVYNAAITAVVDVILGLALIPGYGATGAAIAWASANALNPLLSIVELAVLAGVHPFRRHYVVPVVLTGVPVAVVFAVLPFAPSGLLLPALGLLIAVLFVGIVLLTGSVDHGDALALEVVESMLGRRLTWLRRIGAWRVRARQPDRP
ncbi:MAG: oligosaccharide flippase family protein [Thermoplasmata archaeon]|nr:oligosaccharide flippase family protein [Thermoplasmata archaeon]